MDPVWLWIICLGFSHAVPGAVSQDPYIEIPENYHGHFPLYLKKLEIQGPEGPAPMQVVDSYDGLFGVEPDSGFLFVTRPLDREEQAQYTLQVIVTRDDGQPLSGPETLTVRVKDENDNVPRFTEDVFAGTVSQGTGQGVSFLFVSAADLDDPLTPNADLRYQIISQAPGLPSDAMFQLDSRTGALSLTEGGNSLLDPAQVAHYSLLVQVKDLGEQPSGHHAIAKVDIAVVENTWIPPSSVHLPENLKTTYPHPISKVHWSGGGVAYSQESVPVGLFSVDGEGQVYVTQELDREVQAEYVIRLFARNAEGTPYAHPLELQVLVTDENDNPPVFSRESYEAEVKEGSPPGTVVLQVQAEDADEAASLHAHVVYEIGSQEPPSAQGSAFHVDPGTGTITLQDGQLRAGDVEEYRLRVVASDLAGAAGGLSSTVEVTVRVMDVNDHPPVFSEMQYGPVSLPADAAIGTLVSTLTATDADWELEFKLINFSIVSGNDNGTFALESDQQDGSARIRLHKKLNYEEAQSHVLIVTAHNPEDLVGAEPGPRSTATVTILVEDIPEPLVFSQEKYEVSVPADVPPGTVLLTIQVLNLETHLLRFSLRNDSRKWLSIDEHSGAIRTEQELDPRLGREHTVVVVAQKRGNPGLAATADVVIHILGGRSAALVLGRPSTPQHLCTPQQKQQEVLVSVQTQGPPGGAGPFNFALAEDVTLRRNWRIRVLNGTHASLSMGISWLEPGTHQVPIILTDSAETWPMDVPVTVCLCNSENLCMVKVGKMRGMPTLLSAVGIMVGTLAAIGFFLILIFSHLALKKKKEEVGPSDTLPLQSTA
ncbi:cadherin-16 [Tachyglossus aculeatus]|uniref:cadherin-16 n=1 Tax=Tachyglossus aculeatus TaxID=9261 RepID=UPI0018F7756C|nr:cadherin-16 [Tachyglossus aculeatus]